MSQQRREQSLRQGSNYSHQSLRGYECVSAAQREQEKDRVQGMDEGLVMRSSCLGSRPAHGPARSAASSPPRGSATTGRPAPGVLQRDGTPVTAVLLRGAFSSCSGILRSAV